MYTEGCTVASAYTLRSRCDACVTSRHLSYIVHHSPKHANWPPPARRTDRENFDPLYAAVPACVPVKDRSMTSVRYIFTARRCALARSLLSPGVCPSVTLVHCIHTAEDIVKLLCSPDSTITLVFLTPAPVPNSKGNPMSGGAKYKGLGKFCDFLMKSPSISETVRDRPMVAMEH